MRMRASASGRGTRARLGADGAVLNDDALLGADAEALGGEAVDGRVRLLLRHVVTRQEHVQRLGDIAQLVLITNLQICN